MDDTLVKGGYPLLGGVLPPFFLGGGEGGLGFRALTFLDGVFFVEKSF